MKTRDTNSRHSTNRAHELLAQARLLRQSYDRVPKPPHLGQWALGTTTLSRGNVFTKLRIMASFVGNLWRVPIYRRFVRTAKFACRGSDAVVAAYCTSHLCGLPLRHIADCGITQILTRVWLTTVNLGDDVLDDYVSGKMCPTDVLKMTRDVFTQPTIEGKALVFIQHVAKYLSETDRHELAWKYFGASGHVLTRRIVEAFDYDHMLSASRHLNGRQLSEKTIRRIQTALAEHFDVCMHSYAIERTTMACVATPEDLIQIYRVKAVCFQCAFMAIAEAHLSCEEKFANRRSYVSRLKRVGAVEMERAMFRDDINDLASDILEGRPNLVVAIALNMESSPEFVLMVRHALEGQQFSRAAIKSLMPLTYGQYLRLQDSERQTIGVRRKPLFSWFLGFCIDVSSIGLWRTLRNRIAILNCTKPKNHRHVQPTDKFENMRLAWLVGGQGTVLSRLASFGIELSLSAADVVVAMVRRGMIPSTAMSIVQSNLQAARELNDVASAESWQVVMSQLQLSNDNVECRT